MSNQTSSHYARPLFVRISNTTIKLNLLINTTLVHMFLSHKYQLIIIRKTTEAVT